MKLTMKTVAAVAMAMAVLGASPALAKKAAVKHEVTGVVNLNTASATQLDLLPGVGPKAVKRIIEVRTRTPFTKVDELVKVKGFGAKKLARLKPYLSVNGPTTIAMKKGSGATVQLGEPIIESQGRSAPRPR
jgi:competence protein ComEA